MYYWYCPWYTSALRILNNILIILLQDTISSLASDLNHPAIKRSKNVESFLSRCKYPSPAKSSLCIYCYYTLHFVYCAMTHYALLCTYRSCKCWFSFLTSAEIFPLVSITFRRRRTLPNLTFSTSSLKKLWDSSAYIIYIWLCVCSFLDKFELLVSFFSWYWWVSLSHELIVSIDYIIGVPLQALEYRALECEWLTMQTGLTVFCYKVVVLCKRALKSLFGFCYGIRFVLSALNYSQINVFYGLNGLSHTVIAAIWYHIIHEYYGDWPSSYVPPKTHLYICWCNKSWRSSRLGAIV